MVEVNKLKLFACDIVQFKVPRRLKQFISRSFAVAFVLGMASFLYDQIGPTLAGDYFTPIWWAIQFAGVAVIMFISVRLCIGLHNGHLLFDDLDD